MARIGYHVSHEQFTPRELLEWVCKAQEAGFDCAMSSDHIAPWSERQGQSGFALSWLGAAMQATTLPFGLITVPAGWRYHPTITAQAGATLAQMFPGRLSWMALGSGQALNEHVTGERWPSKAERNARIGAAAAIIRELWAGKTVTRDAPIRVDEARLYTLPDRFPRLIGAALTPSTAAWAASWADGLITINQPRDKLEAIIDAFRANGGEGKQLILQTHLSFAGTDDEARSAAFDQWRSNAAAPVVTETLRSPEDFDAASLHVRPEDMDSHVRISSDIERHLDWIAADVAMGFDEIYLHNVGRNQAAFIEAFGTHIKSGKFS